MSNVDLNKAGDILSKAKILAEEYKKLTGKPLGITSEVAEYEAARLLNLQLCDARQPGYDALRCEGNKTTKVQIKGRVVPTFPKLKGRAGQIKLKHEWDVVILVLLNDDFEPKVMYEANRGNIEKALREPGSRARNERGALSISQFKAISKEVWAKH